MAAVALVVAFVAAACSDDGTSLTATSSTDAAAATSSSLAPTTSSESAGESSATTSPSSSSTSAVDTTEVTTTAPRADLPAIRVDATNSGELAASRRSLLQPINGVPIERSWTVLLPPDLAPDDSLPVLWAFHGAGGGGTVFESDPFIRRLVATGQAVAVLPNGHSDDNPGVGQGFWNLGFEASSADDPQFVGWIRSDLHSIPGLDHSRQYAIGFSNGGGFINLLAKTTDHFDAVAPMFSQQLEQFGALEPVALVSVLQITGDADRIIPNDGGDAGFAGPFLSANESGANWARLLECGGPSVTTVDWADTTMTVTDYGDCAGDERVVIAVGAGLGHGFQGPANVDALERVWRFFTS